VLQQAFLSANRVRVSRETQVYNRYLNVAFDPTVSLLCMLNGIDVADDMTAHPMMERLHVAICRIGGIINDLISFPKEAAATGSDAQYQNLVAATYRELADGKPVSNPLTAAIQGAIDFHNREYLDVLEIGSVVVAGRPSLLRYVELGLDMHRSWMDWCLGAERYRTPDPTALRADRPARIRWPAPVKNTARVNRARDPGAL
jgi:hypothetical protein